jgi:transposase
VTVETTVTVVGCGECGTRAEAHDRRPVDLRDLACFGRPVRLRVLKRRWRCVEVTCATRTWTETHPALVRRAVMTHRAGFEAARHVGRWPVRCLRSPISTGCVGTRSWTPSQPMTPRWSRTRTGSGR